MAPKEIPYSEQDLYDLGPQITYSGRNLDEIAFPLGGIGTGMVTLGGWGQLRDFEMQNRPAKGNIVPNSFFAVRVRSGKKDLTRVLQGPVEGSFTGDGHSIKRFTGEGLPHFRNVSFRGEFPFAFVEMSDPDVPVNVALEAWNPFIPLNEKDSGLPIAIFSYRLENTSSRAVEGTVFATTSNPLGVEPGAAEHPWLARGKEHGVRRNAARRSAKLSGLYMTCEGLDDASPLFGTMALAAIGHKAAVLPSWREESLNALWWGMAEGAFPPKEKGDKLTGTVAVKVRIPAGKSVTVPFVYAWHFPNFQRYWGNEKCKCAPPAWKNWYSTVWRDAWDAASYVAKNFTRLREETAAFHDALFSSTLPPYVLDSVSANISTLKTPTCVRLTDGTFYAFEGCSNTSGCCDGSCTHVWNYAQTLPYLFPRLQRSQREADYNYAMRKDGFIQFRLPLPLGTRPDFKFHPAADGQMGGIIQVWREYLVSGDVEWLKSIWPKAKKALEFAWKYWDADRDGVMEGMQHNTYDIEFYGPNSLMGSLYLGALRAAGKIAEAVGDVEAAEDYRELFKKGSEWTDRVLFNGEYYQQKVYPDAHRAWPKSFRKMAERAGRDGKFPWPRQQVGKGCMSDQLLGEWYAAMLGLGHIYKRQNVRKALKSIFKYNWKADLSEHPSTLRIYAVGDEAGLLIGSWPKGGRPGHPFMYADEVWCGVEYQVASHMIYEGLLDEGLAIVRGARERHRGDRRNPWDEFECGHHYARSMASYGVLTALSGFSYSGAERRIGFAPRVHADDFRSFWSVASGWGDYSQRFTRSRKRLALEVKYGTLRLGELDVALPEPLPAKCSAKVGGVKVKAELVPGKKVQAVFRTEAGKTLPPKDNGRALRIVLEKPVTLKPGTALEVTLR